jgi:ATP synthase protein I
MSDDPALDKLKKEIQEAKRASHPHKPSKPASASNRYFNVGVELVSGVLAGVGVGLLLDWVFGTSPWGLISLFILGSAAGMLNIYRSLTREEKKEKPHD